ncbi:SH3 domain-containing protein [Flavobacterium sp. RSP49]|uniref:SH3 domain-containing protein n=1 Tax=Flavobacterium sp. RSP49 TaxID=2497487 RepID=UPI000F843420|nr:SH3 domain-containing protein [Flavobacterium sp. RSP49]RTY99950.1 SH3 domain-containing protein [Flavobacterium sp. RSP49]
MWKTVKKELFLDVGLKKFKVKHVNYNLIMKKKALLLFLILISNSIFCQSYLGMITKQVNFREGSSTDESIISSLKPYTQIFIISLGAENDYYNVIDIATDREGYVHKSYVKVGEVVNKSNGSFISASGNSARYDAEATIFNNTTITLTLKLNVEVYRFSPKETKNTILTPGDYDFRASAPGVMPNVGVKNFENNRTYTWQFYIVSR